jgi:hypothetical protein
MKKIEEEEEEYSGDLQFKSSPNTGFPDKDFTGFLQSLQTNAGRVRKLRSDQFLPNHFQFIIHHHPVIRRYSPTSLDLI